MLAVEMNAVSKSYRRRRGTQRALDGLHLRVEVGGVHGFLGPNGSGKTTTIRILLGLVRVDSGQVSLLGRSVPARLPEVVGSVGAMVETPLFFPGFSGRSNLRLLSDAAGLPRSRVEEVLSLVDLLDRGEDKYKGYSLGMKQRLGIAAALLKKPQLLILDEPSNGLDPAGIRDVRELIRRLAMEEATTVLLSSHLLAEVEQICDSVSIVARGRCITSGSVAAVLAGRSSGVVRVRVSNQDSVFALLIAAGYSVEVLDDTLLVSAVTRPSELNRFLVHHGYYVDELTPVLADLEDAFLELTSDLK